MFNTLSSYLYHTQLLILLISVNY